MADGEHSLAGSTHPAVEPELLLEAGEDGGVARMGVALEVVDFDRPLEDVEDVIADNVFHRAVALGELGPVLDPGEAVFTIERRGAGAGRRVRAAGGDARPSSRASWSGAGERAAPGELVIAGALAPAAPVAAGDVAELEVERVGAVSLRF